MIKLNFTVYSPDYKTKVTEFNQETVSTLRWTRRYNELGDFEIVRPATSPLVDRLLALGQIVEGSGGGVSGAMVIEQIRISTRLGEGTTITLSGRSVELVLLHMAPLAANPLYPLDGSINDIVARILKRCDAARMTPYPLHYKSTPDFVDRPYFDQATVEDYLYGGVAPGDQRLAISPLEIIQAMAKNAIFPFGYRLERQTDHLQLVLYKGEDLRNDVYFSEAEGNLLSSEFVADNADTWNEVYCTTGQNPGPVVTIQGDGIDHTTPNTAIYRADMYPPLDPKDKFWKSTCGMIANKFLREHQATQEFQCEVDPQNPPYGSAYNLGDLVSVNNGYRTLGVRVIEMTYCYSASGEEYHPVLEYERGD